MTVVRAFRPYIESAKIVAIRGKGTFVASPELLGTVDSPVLAQSARTSDESIAGMLLARIHSGHLREGDCLPAVKFIAKRFRASQHTVISAYRKLRERGYVHKVGKRYWIGDFTTLCQEAVHREVWVFFSEHPGSQSISHNDRVTSMAFTHLESILARAGYYLRYFSMAHMPALLTRAFGGKTVPHGVVFYKMDRPHSDTFWGLYQEALSGPGGAALRRTPIIIDQFSSYHQSRTAPNVHRLYRSSIVSAQMRSIARFAVTEGYDAVRYYPPSVGTLLFGHVLDYAMLFSEISDPAIPVGCNLTLTPGQAAQFSAHLHASDVMRDAVIRVLHSRCPADFDAFAATIVTRKALERSFPAGRERILLVFRSDAVAVRAILAAGKRHSVSRRKAFPGILSLDNDPAYYGFGITRSEIDVYQLAHQMARTIIRDMPVGSAPEGAFEPQARILRKLTA